VIFPTGTEVLPTTWVALDIISRRSGLFECPLPSQEHIRALKVCRKSFISQSDFWLCLNVAHAAWHELI